MNHSPKSIVAGVEKKGEGGGREGLIAVGEGGDSR